MVSLAPFTVLLVVSLVAVVGAIPVGVLLGAGALAAAPGRSRLLLGVGAVALLLAVLVGAALALGLGEGIPSRWAIAQWGSLLGIVLHALAAVLAAVLVLVRRAGTTAATAAGTVVAATCGAPVLEQVPAFLGVAPPAEDGGAVAAVLGLVVSAATVLVVAVALAALGRFWSPGAGAAAVAALFTGPMLVLQVLAYALHHLLHGIPLVPMPLLLGVSVLGLGVGAVLAASGVLGAGRRDQEPAPR